jgi:hypothetical protein
MQKKVTRNKDFRTLPAIKFAALKRGAMQKTRVLKDLLANGSPKLTSLKARIQARAGILEQVRSALPARLALHVASAGIDQGRLTVGVSGAVWASRLRYETENLRCIIGTALNTAVHSVRIRVLP